MNDYKAKYGIQDLEYRNGESILSAVMGRGSVKVTDTLLNDDGFVGVSFSNAPDNKVIGFALDQCEAGESILEKKVEFQMLFDNPDSIDVVISKLFDARSSLMKTRNLSLFDRLRFFKNNGLKLWVAYRSRKS